MLVPVLHAKGVQYDGRLSFLYFYIFPPFTPSVFDTLGHDLAPVCETPVPEVKKCKTTDQWAHGAVGLYRLVKDTTQRI